VACGQTFSAPDDRTQKHALTVAGQWRIFTAFPNISLQPWNNLRKRAGGTIPAAPVRRLKHLL